MNDFDRAINYLWRVLFQTSATAVKTEKERRSRLKEAQQRAFRLHPTIFRLRKRAVELVRQLALDIYTLGLA